jgi:hypothetical protein
MKYLKKWGLFENKWSDYLNIEEIENNFLDINDLMIDWIDKDIEVEYHKIIQGSRDYDFGFIIGRFKNNKFEEIQFNSKNILEYIYKELKLGNIYYRITFGYEPHIINNINHDNPPEKYGLILKECYLETSKRLESVFNIELLKTKVFDIREGRYYNLNERILNDHKFNLKYEITFKIN